MPGTAGIIAISGLVVLLAACSEGGSTGQKATVTTTVTVTPTVQPSSEATTSSPRSSEPVGDSTTPTSPIVTGTAGTPKTLALADIFDPGGWREGSFAPAQAQAEVQAMALDVSCGTDPQTMELRFAQVTGSLEITIGQWLKSQTSKAVLEISVDADGRRVATGNVRFKELKVVKVDVTGVGALIVGVSQVRSPTGGCNPPTTALITKMSLGS